MKQVRHESVSAKTAAKLRDVIASITFAPGKFDMDSWAGKGGDECGTTCCIAGYAIVNDSPNPLGAAKDLIEFEGFVSAANLRPSIRRAVKAHTEDEAGCGCSSCIAAVALKARPAAALGQAILGLTNKQESKLFYTWGWPAEYKDAFTSAPSPRLKAHIAAARIEHFIATGE